MLASVVLLPEPVGPVTRNSPRGRMHQVLCKPRQAQALHRQQLVGNLPQHHADVAALLEDRHAKPGRIAKGKAKVRTTHLLQFLLAAFGRDALHQRLTVSSGSSDLGLQLDASGRASRMTGGCPTAMCRSLAPCLMTVCNNLSIKILCHRACPRASTRLDETNNERASVRRSHWHASPRVDGEITCTRQEGPKSGALRPNSGN